MSERGRERAVCQDSCGLDGWIRWNVPRSDDWQPAKELEIGHKLSGRQCVQWDERAGNHVKIFAAGVSNAEALLVTGQQWRSPRGIHYFLLTIIFL